MFCLVPAGDTPTSRRLFDAILAGCLPVVISDEIDDHMPFAGTVPYGSFIFRVTEADWLRDPVGTLEALLATPDDEIRRRQACMAIFAPCLNWRSGSGVLSMILRSMRTRKGAAATTRAGKHSGAGSDALSTTTAVPTAAPATSVAPVQNTGGADGSLVTAAARARGGLLPCPFGAAAPSTMRKSEDEGFSKRYLLAPTHKLMFCGIEKVAITTLTCLVRRLESGNQKPTQVSPSPTTKLGMICRDLPVLPIRC